MKKVLCLLYPLAVWIIMFSFPESICGQVDHSELNRPASFYTIADDRDIPVSHGVFYDAGGPDADAGHYEKLTTLHAVQGYLRVYFTDLQLPAGAELWIFLGKTTEDSVFGVFRQGEKIPNIEGQHITFLYKPSFVDFEDAAGWEAQIESFYFDGNVKVTWPESDCPFALPLCNNASVMTGLEQYTDLGNITDDSGTCYSGTGSGGSVWYAFSPSSDGPLDFTISPTSSTDYDFVLWDITNGCESGVRQQLSCNYSLYHGPTGLHNSNCGIVEGDDTGDCTTDSKGSSYNRWNRRVNVLASHRYAICVNFYSGSNHGFTLSFQQQAGSVSIGDNTPPTVANSWTPTCVAPTLIHIQFSEWVQCSSIQGSDFTLAGYTFTVVNDYCNNGRTIEVDLAVSPAMVSGNYTINIAGILDMCGNVMNFNYPITIGTPVTTDAGTDKVICRSPGFLGIGYTYSPSSQTLTATSGGGTQYEWSNGILGASTIVAPTATTTYTVTVSNSGCTATDLVTVWVEHAYANAGTDQTICQGASATLTGSGAGTVSWAWSTGGSPVGNTQSITVTPSSNPATYTLTTTTAHGCTRNDNVVINLDPITAVASNQNLCTPSSVTLDATPSNNEVSYNWQLGGSGGTVLGSGATLTVNPSSTTTYYLQTTSASGCTASSLVYVNIADYGAITSFNGSDCDPNTLTFTSTPAVPGATSYTFTWYSASGLGGSCPADPTGMTQVMQETLSTLFDTTLLPLQTFDAFVNTPIGAGYSGWSEVTQTGSVNHWAFGATAPISTRSLCIRNGAGTYNAYLNTDDCNKIAYLSTPFNATSCDNIRVSFRWKCQGQRESSLFGCFSPAASGNDYGNIVYALSNPSDPASWVSFGGPYHSQSSTQTVTNLLLPAAANGQTFYIGFKWYNDNIAGGCTSVNPFMVDDVTLVATKHKVPTSSYNPPALVPPTDQTYVLYVTPVGGTCNNISSLAANCYIAGCPGPLPVELLSFNAFAQGEINQLEWITASETDNDYFDIQRSQDGQHFEEIGRVQGAGNSAHNISYYFKDLQPFEKSFYRLKQTDFNGSTKLSYTVTVIRTAGNGDFTLWPVPAASHVQVSFNSPKAGNTVLEILDLTGRLVLQHEQPAEEGPNSIFLDLSGLKGGIYYIRISGKNDMIKKLIRY